MLLAKVLEPETINNKMVRSCVGKYFSNLGQAGKLIYLNKAKTNRK